MQRRGALRGFTLVEMLVVITIIGILAGLAIPNMTKARIKAKETEVKSGLHSIQTSVERYFVDNQRYPPYLVGGSVASWSTFQQRLATASDTHAGLNDPLIKGGYLEIYPQNPFVSNGVAVVMETGGNDVDPGSGDPRFGMAGREMGNLMDDPRFTDEITTPNEFNRQYIYSRQGVNADLTDQPYPTGGKLNFNNLDANGQPSKAYNWWPGNFFYRAVGPIDWGSRHPNEAVESPREIWTFFVSRYESYMLGGYGDKTTDGLDVVRTVVDPDLGNQYRTPPNPTGATYPVVSLDNGTGNASSLPEVMGGGDADNNPYFPYVQIQQNSSGTASVLPGYTYGAPDGVTDGIVQVLTPDNQDFSHMK